MLALSSGINVVVVGYGFAGRAFHCYLVRLVPQLHLYGVCARDPAVRERASSEQGCETFADFEQVLSDPAVDLVVLATPHDTHAPMAMSAMRAGKHVVTDKVMCLNLAECEQMIAASRQTRKFLTVFHNRRLDGDFLTIKKALADGSLGDVRWMELSWQKFGMWKRWRAFRAAGGGRLMDLGAHLLDQILLLHPSPVVNVYCRMHTDHPEFDVETHAMVTLSFADGRTAICDVGTMSRCPKPRYLLLGENATLVKHGLDPQEAATIAGNIDSAGNDPAQDASVYRDDGTTRLPTINGRWRSFYENVADVLLNGAEPLVKLEEMRRLMGVLDACFVQEARGTISN